MKNVSLQEIVTFLDETFQVHAIQDFPNACNGLQLENNGSVTRIATAVDANVHTMEAAIAQKADLLCVHHGLTWRGLQTMTGPLYELYQKAMAANLAIYSIHLPLDWHPEYNHNLCMAKKLGLSIEKPFTFYKERPYGYLCAGIARETFEQRLKKLFPHSFRAFCYGSLHPQQIAIMSGGGGEACLKELVASHADTLLTGEIHYSSLSFAQLYHLNLFACGHYATECFGVKALVPLLQEKMHLPCDFIDDFCEL